MFLKVFTKKNYLIFIAIATITLIFSFILFLLNNIYKINSSVETSLSVDGSQNFFIDLNGDGKKDYIYISKAKENYIITCNIKEKNYQLNAKSPISNFGVPSAHWPMSINFLDISRDKIPEIIIQSSENNNSIFHLFKWTGKEFKDVYCSTNEIFGILDSQNNKSPKFLSFSINTTENDIQKHMLLGNNLKNISYEKYNIPAYGSILEFINLITLPYNLYDLPNIFNDNIDIKEFDQLNKENYYYIFQDAFFKDIDWDKDGNIIKCFWNLRFRKCSKDNQSDPQLLEWKFYLKKDGSKFYIDSIE